MLASVLLQAALTALFSLSFNDGAVPGVEGQAAFFDGFDSRIIVPASEVPAPARDFTLDVWVCPIAFPKSPCPVACRQRTDAPGGWSLWLDAMGKVHFQVASAGEWAAVCAPEGLPLRQWSRLSALFRSGSGLYLAIDGKQVAWLPLELPSVEQERYDLYLGRTQVKTPSFFENKSIPIFSSLDGALDEFCLYGDRNAYESILKQDFVRPAAPDTDVAGFEERVLPSGPDPLAFGAWYLPLEYYPAFDKRWRGNLPDVVVGFGEQQPWKVVFWRGISYAPCFVTEKGHWMSNEFIERSKVTGWGCPESMSDKHADYSSVRIVENTPARTVIVWRNIPVGVNQKIPYQSEETQWGDCSEETYVFYPDGTGVRKMELWTSHPEDWYEWCQSLQVLHPSQCPEDVLDASRILSVAAMDGRHAEFGWNFEGKARQDEPSLPGANIQVSYLRSEWNPYLILEDGPGLNEKGQSGPRIDRYAGRWSDYSDFPWRNHWPVTQDYVIGRYACIADAPSHTYTATQYNAPHAIEGDKMTKLMLCGCTRGDAASLLPLAKSWLRAPVMTCGSREIPYDLTQRAYVTDLTALPGNTGTLSFHVDASPEHPVSGLCLIVKGLSKEPASVRVDGKRCADAKAGIHNACDGPSLILWIPVQTDNSLTIKIH